jgi:hypothetical protein
MVEVEQESGRGVRIRTSIRRFNCGICFDDELTKLDGILCAEGHMTCQSCFNWHCAEDCLDSNMARFHNDDGKLFCPKNRPRNMAGACGAGAYSDRAIAEHAADKAFSALIDARAKLIETKYARESEIRIKEAVQKETERLQRMSQHQRLVHTARTHIADHILNLQCPRCGAVYVDFIGCCALKCARPGCGAGYCAYCQQDCGADAHAHVSRCALGGGQTFSSMVRLDSISRARRQRAVDAYLSTLAPSVRADVVTASAIDLRDLGISAH